MATVETKIDNTDSNWINSLYQIDLVSEEELKEWSDLYSYKGFNRAKILSQLRKKFPDPKEAAEVIVICAMKGPLRASVTKMKNGKTLESQGIPGSRAQGTDLISCQRVTAATADLAAFFLKRMNCPKRIGSLSCPGWLQFPSAGSIDLPYDLRQAHIEFSKMFSGMIGGEFNEQIYKQMVDNSYLNAQLKLFDSSSSSSSSSSVPKRK